MAKKLNPYERQRNKLIPEAVEFANQKAGPKPDNKLWYETWCNEWNRWYFRAMNTLYRERYET